MAEFVEGYEKLRVKKDELFEYQSALVLGHRQMEDFDKMEGAVKCLDEIWKVKVQEMRVLEFIENIGYGRVGELQLAILTSFMADSDKYYLHLECLELLNELKMAVAGLLKVIKLIELLDTNNLTPEHVVEMKSLIKATATSGIKCDLMFSKDSKNTITPQRIIRETNLTEIESQLSELVFLSSQENVVKTQMSEIE